MSLEQRPRAEHKTDFHLPACYRRTQSRSPWIFRLPCPSQPGHHCEKRAEAGETKEAAGASGVNHQYRSKRKHPAALCSQPSWPSCSLPIISTAHSSSINMEETCNLAVTLHIGDPLSRLSTQHSWPTMHSLKSTASEYMKYQN